MENQNQNQINQSETKLGMNEIEFKQIFKFISRNSKTLSYIICAGFLMQFLCNNKKKYGKANFKSF